MSVASRCALMGVVALPVTLFAAPAAAADATAVAVDKSAWSWRKALPTALPVAEPSRVPAGGLAVAYDGDPDGQPTKATYLRLDLGGLAPGSRVEGLTVSLPLDPAAENSDSESVRLVACRLLAPFAPGEGVDPAAMPKEDCAGAPAGRFDAASATWTFVLTALAQDWAANAGSNHGIVVRPPAEYRLPTDLPFQLVFQGPSKVKADLVAEAPAVAAPPQAGPVAREDALPPTFTSAEPPAFDSPAAPPAQPSVTLPEPMPAAVAAPEPAALPVAAPAAQVARVLPPARTSTGALWSLGALFGLLLAAVSRVAGNTAGPLAFARLERERLDRLRLQVPVAVSAPAVPEPVQVPQTRQGRRPMSSATSTVT